MTDEKKKKLVKEILFLRTKGLDILSGDNYEEFSAVLDKYLDSDIDKLKFSKEMQVSSNGTTWVNREIVFIDSMRIARDGRGSGFVNYREIKEPKWRALKDNESLKQFKDCWFRWTSTRSQEFKMTHVDDDKMCSMQSADHFTKEEAFRMLEVELNGVWQKVGVLDE